MSKLAAAVGGPSGVVAGYQAAGLLYVCPQLVARELMTSDAADDVPFLELLPRYNGEARDVTARVIDRCQKERRAFALLDTDFEEESFHSSFALAGKPGILTIFRNQTPAPSTTVTAWFPE